ncbi:MAG TPA: cytochrome P450 [Roseiarcus sp.]|nr:cytochrome P450 [Roseiarcus sp.]
MTAQSSPFVPPAPTVHTRDLPVWRLLWNVTRSTVSIWPDYAFDILYARSRVLGVETLLVSDPEGVRHVLTANAGNYRRPYSVTRVARPLVGSGLFLAEGADWRRQRRLLAPTFTPATIGLLLPHFRDAGLHLLRSIEKSSQANLSKAFQDTALEAVLRALFSLPESGDREKLCHMAREYIEGPGRPTLIDGFSNSEDTFAFANARRARFQKHWRAAIDQIISRRKASPTPAAHRDLLDLLLSVRDAETGEALSDAEIRDQCATMFFAGSETTARLMFWASYLLAMDPEEQTSVRKEIAAFRPERIDGLDDIQNWRRLRNVLLEALRLYPPLPQILRNANGPDDICGEKIGADTRVWISSWLMHRHRRFWDRPTAFLPDRFAGKTAPWTQTPAFIPFGAGPRICIGLSFALSEAAMVMAQLLSRYRVSLPGARPVLPVGRVTIEPSYEPLFRLDAA